jgi:hypothetical protein
VRFGVETATAEQQDIQPAAHPCEVRVHAPQARRPWSRFGCPGSGALGPSRPAASPRVTRPSTERHFRFSAQPGTTRDRTDRVSNGPRGSRRPTTGRKKTCHTRNPHECRAARRVAIWLAERSSSAL